MTRIEDLKAQIAVLRNKFKAIDSNEKLTIAQKTNEIVNVSKDIRTIYLLNQLETDKRVKKALSTKEHTQIKHGQLDDPSDSQYPLKTQIMVLRRILFSPEWATMDSNKWGTELPDEILNVQSLNRKEVQKLWEVAEANYNLGFKYQNLDALLEMSQLDEDHIDSPTSPFEDL